MAGRKVTRDDLRQAAEKYKNWGKWGPDDEIGTLNYTSPEDIVAAAQLVKKGKVISLALNFDNNGPQGGKTNYPALGRINPLHTMLRTGTDAYSGVLDKRGIRAADDMVVMPLQCGTQWDGLGHVFYENNMWNGYDCREVSSFGAQKCGIEKTKSKMVGRGVFLDVARALGKDCLDDGYGITCADLDLTAKKQNITFKRGDYIIVRTGQMERCLKAGSWDGYPGGDAPGFAFETLEFVAKTELAALASDTWGCEADTIRSAQGEEVPRWESCSALSTGSRGWSTAASRVRSNPTCSPSRSRARCSARWMTGLRSSPRAAPLSPMTSLPRSPRLTTTGFRYSPTAWASSWPRWPGSMPGSRVTRLSGRCGSASRACPT